MLSTSVNLNNKKSGNHASAAGTSTASSKTNRKRGRDDEIDHDDGSACAALKCLHPTGKLVSWVACDKCNKWFHQSCVGIDSKSLDKEDKYFCDVCRNNSNNSLNTESVIITTTTSRRILSSKQQASNGVNNDKQQLNGSSGSDADKAYAATGDA